MSNERMMEKIRKLFALANCEGATDNEAATAMRMANKLLDKHSISMIDLASPEEVGLSFISNGKQKWICTVFNAITKLYDCRYFTDHNWEVPKHIIVGTQSNRLTASIVIDHLIDQIKKETKGETMAFRLSAAQSLYWICDGILKERASSDLPVMPGTSLIPLDLIKKAEIENEDYIKANIGHLSKGRKTKSAYSAAGAAYGKGLNPGARVTGTTQARIS